MTWFRPDREQTVEIVRLANIALADIGLDGVVRLHEGQSRCSPRWSHVYRRDAMRATALATLHLLGPDIRCRCAAHLSARRPRPDCAGVTVRESLMGRLCERVA